MLRRLLHAGSNVPSSYGPRTPKALCHAQTWVQIKPFVHVCQTKDTEEQHVYNPASKSTASLKHSQIDIEHFAATTASPTTTATTATSSSSSSRRRRRRRRRRRSSSNSSSGSSAWMIAFDKM